jgi:hypothetical protein
VAGTGTALFQAVCERDMEGIVAKLAGGGYTPEQTTWVKIKNRAYSQAEGRTEFFEGRTDPAGVARGNRYFRITSLTGQMQRDIRAVARRLTGRWSYIRRSGAFMSDNLSFDTSGLLL